MVGFTDFDGFEILMHGPAGGQDDERRMKRPERDSGTAGAGEEDRGSRVSVAACVGAVA